MIISSLGFWSSDHRQTESDVCAYAQVCLITPIPQGGHRKFIRLMCETFDQHCSLKLPCISKKETPALAFLTIPHRKNVMQLI